MLVEIDARSGFCHGVVTAIRKAEEELERTDAPLYCLGDIVHNSDEVERLERKGLSTITHDDLPRLDRGCFYEPMASRHRHMPWLLGSA